MAEKAPDGAVAHFGGVLPCGGVVQGIDFHDAGVRTPIFFPWIIVHAVVAVVEHQNVTRSGHTSGKHVGVVLPDGHVD
jgi:hypothetical protein